MQGPQSLPSKTSIKEYKKGIKGIPGVFFKKLVASTWGCVGTGKKVFKKNPRNTLILV